MRLRFLLIAAAVLGVAVATVAPARAQQLHFDVKRAKLDNGLRVVMLVDHTSPTVAVDIVYDVGARNEERGRTGFAHLFEHMMFQGSANVPRGEHFKLVTSHGGQLNGTTSADRTNYFEMLPSGELALGLWLEADRMKSLDISQKNFENQRSVVKEEYRMRVENAAYVPASLRLEELVFQGYWPYEHSVDRHDARSRRRAARLGPFVPRRVLRAEQRRPLDRRRLRRERGDGAREALLRRRAAAAERPPLRASALAGADRCRGAWSSRTRTRKLPGAAQRVGHPTERRARPLRARSRRDAPRRRRELAPASRARARAQPRDLGRRLDERQPRPGRVRARRPARQRGEGRRRPEARSTRRSPTSRGSVRATRT